MTSFFQDESKATYEGWFKAPEAKIDWSKSGQEIYNLVRGSDPSPGANTTLNGEKVSLYDGSLHVGTQSAPAGSVLKITDEGMHIAVTGGILQIGRLRGLDRKKVAASEFAESLGVSAGDTFGG